MILDPIIQVECDECNDVIELRLTRTGRGWDDRDVEADLEKQEWKLSTDDKTFCSVDCQKLYEEKKNE